jgi:hypothetical protein
MKKNTLVLFSLFAFASVSAQEVVSTQGDSYSNGSGSISFTIGEVISNTGTDGTLTQGFHQSNWNFLGLENHAPNFEAVIFPNPTSAILNIRTSTFENVTYTLYDGQGKRVMQNMLSSEQTPVQVGQLAPGSYSVTLNSESQQLKTFKLVKIQ